MAFFELTTSQALAGTANVAKTETAKTKNVQEAVAPTRVLDGFGGFVAPPSTARPVPADFVGSATADHPPGFYGPPEALFAGIRAGRVSFHRRSLEFGPLIYQTGRAMATQPRHIGRWVKAKLGERRAPTLASSTAPRAASLP